MTGTIYWKYDSFKMYNFYPGSPMGGPLYTTDWDKYIYIYIRHRDWNVLKEKLLNKYIRTV